MEQSNQSKKVLLSVIGVAILVVAVVGVSFAFFNYTRAGQTNTVTAGKIWFTSTQSGAMTISNVFPGTANGTTVKVNVQGGTTYASGMTYRLRAVDVKQNGATYDGRVPILVKVAVDEETGGTITTNGTFTPATGTGTGGGVGTGIILSNGVTLGTGTITGNPSGATATDVSGDIDVTGYIDPKVAITDTLEGTVTTGYVNGTTTQWVNGRQVVSTETWNSLGQYPVSFRILVEAIETGGQYIS